MIAQAALATARLALEPLTAAHADALFPGLADPALYAHLPEPRPASVAALRARFARLETRCSPDGVEAWLNWALRRRADDALVGWAQATVRGERALIAYVLASAAGGAGLATEAVARVVAHLFADLGVAEIVAEIDVRNTRSIALVERLGFRRVDVTADEARYALSRPCPAS